MGPQLLIDKSTLQSLSQKEIYFLFKYYFVVISPILLIEVMADLKKPPDSKGRMPNDIVQELANKLLSISISSCINVDQIDICLASLLGAHIPMTGQAIKGGGIPVNDPKLGKGIYFPESEESKMITRWSEGNFQPPEGVAAENWRNYIFSLNPEKDIQYFMKFMEKKRRLKSLQEVKLFISALRNNNDLEYHQRTIGILCDSLNATQNQRNEIFSRWLSMGFPKLHDFAPYAGYLYDVNAFYTFAFGFKIISTRATNHIDLQYLYYLPFCRIFSSSDKFHKNICPFFLREDQLFVDGTVLKSDLRNIAGIWDNSSETERKNLEYPPESPESFTFSVWQKYMKPRGDSSTILSEKDNERMIEKGKQIIEMINRIDKDRNS